VILTIALASESDAEESQLSPYRGSFVRPVSRPVFLLATGIKIVYHPLIFAMFRHVRRRMKKASLATNFDKSEATGNMFCSRPNFPV